MLDGWNGESAHRCWMGEVLIQGAWTVQAIGFALRVLLIQFWTYVEHM